MRASGFVILVAAVLVAVVTGCGGAHRYDGRLTAADSLMWDAPDSALAIVSAIDSLAGEGDRAYRDLLLTQARYKCYQEITASDDSAVTRAMDYYRVHSGDREKLTRAYLYKGAVMEELGHVDSAMYYYKTAEANADEKDYLNLAYSKMRIGDLYRKQYSQNEAAIARLKDAIHLFETINDTTFLISCFGSLGSICGVNQPDLAKGYLNKAIELSQRYDPSRQYTFKSILAGIFFYHDKDYKRANRLAMDVLRNGNEDCLEYQFYYYATMTFLKMGQIDSAKYVLARTPMPIDAVDSMNWYNAVAEVAKAEGNTSYYGENAIKSRDLSSHIIAVNKGEDLVQTELEFDRINAAENDRTNIKHKKNLAAVLAIAIAIVALLAIIMTALKRRLKNKEMERQCMEQELNATIQSLSERVKQLDQMNASTSALVRCRLEAFQELFDSIRFKAKREEDGKKRTILTMRNILSGMGEQYQIMNVEMNDTFWEKLRTSVDGEFNGIVTFVEQHYPNLTARDLRIFCLVCTNVTPQITKICMNLTNVKTVSNYRSNIMKKIGLDITFDEFIQKYQNGELID